MKSITDSKDISNVTDLSIALHTFQIPPCLQATMKFWNKNILFSTVRPTAFQCTSKTCKGKSQQLLKEIKRIYMYMNYMHDYSTNHYTCMSYTYKPCRLYFHTCVVAQRRRASGEYKDSRDANRQTYSTPYFPHHIHTYLHSYLPSSLLPSSLPTSLPT